MPSTKLRQDTIRSLEYFGDNNSQCIYWDEALPAFGVRVYASTQMRVGRMSPRIVFKAASAWRPWVERTCSLLTKPERRRGGILFRSPMGRIRKPKTKRNERRAR